MKRLVTLAQCLVALTLMFAVTTPVLADTLPDVVQTAEEKADTRIDINTASAAEFQTLKGIGKKKAAAIVANRDANGPFKSVDDLTRVKGIGKKTVEKLRPFIKVVAPEEGKK